MLLWFGRWLTRKGVAVRVVLRDGGSLQDQFRQLGQVSPWWRERSRWLPKRLLESFRHRIAPWHVRLAKQVARWHPDVIIYNTCAVGDIAERLARIRCMKIAWIHELEYAIRVFDLRGSSSKVFANSDHFIAVSNAVKENLVANNNVSSDSISVVHEAIESIPFVDESRSEVRQRLQVPMNAVVVGACGSLLLRKGVDMFVEVAQQCLNRSHDHYFVWVGGERDSSALIEWNLELEKLGIADRFQFTGETDDVHSWYRAMDLFLMPSREDPFPLVNLEAAAHGVPIIGFKGSGGTEEFVDDEIGILVLYGEVETMTQAVLSLTADSRKRETLGRNAATRAGRYTIEKQAPLIWEVLLKLH